jgi:O-antigen ligase
MQHVQTAGVSAVTERVGLYASGLFALSAWLAPAGMYVGFYLFVLAALLQPAFWRALARDRLAQVSLLLAAYLVASAGWASLSLPETRAQPWGELREWLKLFAFFPLAWWLRGNERRVATLFLLAGAGWLVGLITEADPVAIALFSPGARTGFKVPTLFSGLLSATALLGLVLISPRLVSSSLSLRGRLLGAAAWLLGLWLSAYALIASRARGAWVSVLVVLPVWALLKVHGSRGVGVGRRAATTAGVLGLLTVALVLAASLPVVQKRLAAERGVASAIVRGDSDDLRPGALTYRYQMLRYGLERWGERPWLGWGVGSAAWLLSDQAPAELIARKRDGRMDWHAHFHNTYLQVLVCLGLAGAGLFGWFFVVLVRATGRAYARGAMSRDLLLFLSGALALFLLYCVTNFSVLRPDTRAYWVLLAAGAYGFCFRPGSSGLGPVSASGADSGACAAAAAPTPSRRAAR